MYFTKSIETELANYIAIFHKIGAEEHHEVNEYISLNGLWDEFREIRSLNNHGRGKEKIRGIYPKYYREVCQRLKLKRGSGSPLQDSNRY